MFVDEYGDFQLPEELNFGLPGAQTVKLHADDHELLYRQLVCWCLCQRFLYYVVNSPLYPDEAYDEIEAYIKQLEAEFNLDCYYSPTKRVGSSRRDDYPPMIRWEFRNFNSEANMSS